MTCGDIIKLLSHYPSNAQVYCNERGRYDDRREVLGVNSLLHNDTLAGQTVFLEYSNV